MDTQEPFVQIESSPQIPTKDPSDHLDERKVMMPICDKIARHVHECKTCQRKLSFDPVEKALLQTHSMSNEIMELIAFLALGAIIIVALQRGINA
jgi:hypothetical protein